MTPKPQTYISDLTNLPKALQPLTTQKRWVVWSWEWRTTKTGGAWTKPPFQCAYPTANAKSNDPNTWGTYGAGIAAVAAGSADGVGFMLRDAEVAAADLDHVRNENTGEILGWAKRLCVEAEELGLYREVTVSGAGLRFIGALQRLPPTYFVTTPNGQLTPDNFSTRQEAEQVLESAVTAGQWKREQVSVHATNELQRKFTFDRSNGTALELFRNCARFITISGLQEGACDNVGPIDDYLDALVARFDGQPAPSPIQTNGFDFNTAGPQTDYYRDLIENGAPEGERSEKFQEVVWHLASLGWTVEQIVDELAKHRNGIGFKYSNRLLREVTRSFGKWQRRRRASATGSSAPMGTMGTSWPQIQIRSGELPRVVSEAEAALLLLGREIYQRGGMVVRPVLNQSLRASADRETESWQLIPMTRPHLVEVLCCAAQFLRHDKRANRFVPVDAPDKVAEAYLNRQGGWKLPLLSGVANAPFLRLDGSICETPGYDPESHLLCKLEDQTFPPVPQYPTKADAEAALGQLHKLIETFPFVSDADCSVALAGFLTVLDRRSLTTAPLIAFTSPTAGTGKSLLVDLMSILASGRLMPVLTQGGREEEFEKRLGASLLAGDAGISIDNCEAPLFSPLLCQALTQRELSIRLLGYSRNVRIETNATIFATGNNLEIAGDLTRRCLLGSLDAGVERPELRSFNVDAIELAHVRRGELVVAALTILRAWHVARMAGEQVNIDSFGGFTDWSERVREPLIWLGEADPCDTVCRVRENDPHRDLLVAVVMQWKEHLGLDTKYTVQEIIGRAVNTPDFYNALLAVAIAKTGGLISNDRLGRWLKRVQGKIVSDLSLVQDGNISGYSRWKLIQR
jgi:hypothetical protein